MPGSVRVGRPNHIRHIPLAWDVTKRRSNHQPKFRPVGDAILRGREKTVGQLIEQMFLEMPSPQNWITGRETAEKYANRAERVAEPFIDKIAQELQVTFNEGALTGQDQVRATMNDLLRRRRSPLRLTDADGDITKAKVNTVGGIEVGKSPKAVWAPIGVEAFDEVSAGSVQYAKFRSATLVTGMLEEQQRVVRDLIGESFTTQQTFRTGRTVTGLTAGQTAGRLVDVLQEMSPRTPIAQNLGTFRGVNAAGLTHPWEKAVFRRAERMADTLAKQGVTGRAAYNKIQKDSQRYANKLRRSRARMISRTEIKRAQIEGKLASFQQSVDDGLVDAKTAGKKWVTGATDVCPMCVDLGMSAAIPLNGNFSGVGDGPPAHPNCRCDLNLVTTLDKAPQAIPALPRSSPHRPGTPENPISWEFPSGFRTQPSATRAFKPPRVPSVPKVPTPPQPVASKPTPEPVPVAEPMGEPPPRAGYSPPPRPDGPTWSEQLSYQQHARTVRGRKEVSDVVLEKMDEVLTAPPRSGWGQTELIFRQKGPKNTLGVFNSLEDAPTPRYPSFPKKLRVRNQSEWDNWEITQGRWTEAQLLEHFEEFGRAAGYKSVDDFVAAHHKYRAKLEAYSEAMEQIAEYGTKSRPTISIYEPEGMSKTNRMVGERQNTFTHESFHSFDYRDRIGSQNSLRSSLSDALGKDLVPGSPTMLGEPYVVAEHQAALEFLEACAESESLKMLMTGPYTDRFKVYASSPEELGARAFSQWFATRHGTPEMVADMLERTVTRHNGYQWTPAEFEESIAPKLEALLRDWGIIG